MGVGMGMRFYPQRDISQCLEMFFIVTNGRVLLAFSGWRPGMLLNILKCTGQHPPQRIIQSKMPIAQGLGNCSGRELDQLQDQNFSSYIGSTILPYMLDL